MSKSTVNIANLSPEERLKLIEQLWDSLCKTQESIPVTDAQQAELDRRIADLEQEGPIGIPWEEVARRIREGR